MKITKRQLRRIIKEEKLKLMTEQNVPTGLIEGLNDAMTAILDHLENNSTSAPEDIPLEALQIIEEEVAGFKEYLGSGYDAMDDYDYSPSHQADIDHANQMYAAEHGDPYEDIG